MVTKEHKINELENIANELRKMIVTISYKSKGHHIGSALSCIDILTTLYFYELKIDPNNHTNKIKDWFMLSKGHAALALYATLAKRGFFKESFLEEQYLKNGGVFGGHPDTMPDFGIEISSGSLGHGLSIGAGVALAAKKDKNKNRAFVLLGDGECNEGMIWEAVMFASHHQLDNLVAIVDFNNLQGLGYVKDVMDISPVVNKFSSFGWDTQEINGNNIKEIMDSLDKTSLQKGKPSLIVANTIKGKGAIGLEDKLESHYEVLSKEKYHQILRFLDSTG
jgi:transketolase